MVRDLRGYLSNLDTTTRNDVHSIVNAGKSLSLRMGEEKPPPCKRPRRDRSKNRVCKEVAVVMEENIWKELPGDLLEKVIARLPIPSIFRFRLVCRSWNSLLRSHKFLQQFAEVRPQSPWFYTITHGNISNGAIYDPSMNKWYHLSLPSPPPKTIISYHVASTGGLVCFIDILHHKFFICNPLTMSFRELPSTVRVSSQVAVGMVLKKASTGYKLLWLECNGDYGVFDSVENTWSKPGNIPQHIKLPLALNFKSQTINIDTVMYFMRTNPDGLVSFDTVKNTWQQLLIPSPQCSMGHTLAVCKGHIFLVGLLPKNATTCVCVWELEKMTLLWKEIDRTPDVMCQEFNGKQVQMSCLGNKGLVLLSLRSRQLNRLVLYDLSKKLWLKVPSCILPRSRKRQWIACGTSFEPCINASVG